MRLNRRTQLAAGLACLGRGAHVMAELTQASANRIPEIRLRV